MKLFVFYGKLSSMYVALHEKNQDNPKILFSRTFQSTLGMTRHAWPNLTKMVRSILFPWMPNCISKLQESKSILSWDVGYSLFRSTLSIPGHDYYTRPLKKIMTNLKCPAAQLNAKKKSNGYRDPPFPLSPMLNSETTKPPPNNPTSSHYLKVFSHQWSYLLLWKE